MWNKGRTDFGIPQSMEEMEMTLLMAVKEMIQYMVEMTNVLQKNSVKYRTTERTRTGLDT